MNINYYTTFLQDFPSRILHSFLLFKVLSFFIATNSSLSVTFVLEMHEFIIQTKETLWYECSRYVMSETAGSWLVEVENKFVKVGKVNRRKPRIKN